jgi:hypothetical protein
MNVGFLTVSSIPFARLTAHISHACENNKFENTSFDVFFFFSVLFCFKKEETKKSVITVVFGFEGSSCLFYFVYIEVNNIALYLFSASKPYLVSFLL